VSVHDSHLGGVEQADGFSAINDKGDAALFEVIPEDELPIDCHPILEKCAASAILKVTTSSGYERRPLCAAHAHVVFAEWMVGA